MEGFDAANQAKQVGLQAMLHGNDLADRDASGYDAVVAAFKLPKDTDEEKAAGKKQLHLQVSVLQGHRWRSLNLH